MNKCRGKSILEIILSVILILLALWFLKWIFIIVAIIIVPIILINKLKPKNQKNDSNIFETTDYKVENDSTQEANTSGEVKTLNGVIEVEAEEVKENEHGDI